MDLIYTDRNRGELGALHGYELDVDVAKDKDFELTASINNDVLEAGSVWYIDETEYGGIVDTIKYVTADREVKYSGRNMRGILSSKVIEPPVGEDYRVVTGNVAEIVNNLLGLCGLSDMFYMRQSDMTIKSHQIDRYITLYDGMCKLAAALGKVLSISMHRAKAILSFASAINYADSKYYTQDDIDFTITQHKTKVNHLVCLGQGELKDRMVLHLYTDEYGNIVSNQRLFGMAEYTQIYENTSSATAEDLRTGGIERLAEINTQDDFEVTIPDIKLRIGDIIGGYEKNTGITVTKRITNIIAKMDESTINIEYSADEEV